MNICNTENICGNCKDFYKNNEKEIFGSCQSLHSKSKNKNCKSEFSKGCINFRKKDKIVKKPNNKLKNKLTKKVDNKLINIMQKIAFIREDIYNEIEFNLIDDIENDLCEVRKELKND
jgi:hypothetical protein